MCRSVLVSREGGLTAASPSHSLTPTDPPRAPPRIPKDPRQCGNHSSIQFSLRKRLPLCPCGMTAPFTHQGATYQSLGWSLREWRRASPWSQKGRGSRNTKRERWTQGTGADVAPGSPGILGGAQFCPPRRFRAPCPASAGREARAAGVALARRRSPDGRSAAPAAGTLTVPSAPPPWPANPPEFCRIPKRRKCITPELHACTSH